MPENFELDPRTWATLRQLLEAALQRPPAERAAWLDQLGREHRPLKPRLEALLARAADDSARLLDTLPRVETAQFVSAPHDDGQDPSPPERIGPYRLLREIGSGGMAVVWLAERSDMLQRRPVALKLPQGVWRTSRLAERMAREREILAPLVHPNIARLYDAGIAGGQPFLALEYVEGERIDRFCERRNLDLRARLRLFLQVAHAVAHAHANLVVHRDLKPSNILVTEKGEVKLLDFGIAKVVSDGEAEETELTRIGGRALTPEYAAPEQIRGEPIGTAADVYSLGVVLYQLLSSQLPYRPKARSRSALEDEILHGDVVRCSDAATDVHWAKALRGDLDTVVQKALRKEPSERYRSVDALADDVQRWLERRPVLAQPDSVTYRLRKFIARNRLAVGAGASVAVALFAGLAVALWQARVALAEQQRAEEVKDFIASIFRDADPWVGPQDKPSAIDVLKRARARIDARFKEQPAIRIELLNVLAESFLGMQDTAAAGELADLALREARQFFGEAHPQTLRARRLKAQMHRNQGDTRGMRAEIEQVLAALEPERHDRAPELVGALTERAELELDEGRYEESEKTVREALRITDTTPGTWHVPRASLWKALAAGLESRLLYESGLHAASEAYRYAREAYADRARHPHLINTRVIYARLLATADRYPEAIALMQQSIDEAAELYGPDSRSVGLYLQNIAVHQTRVGQLDAAEESATRALAILERHYGNESAHFGAGLDAAAFVHLSARRGAKAYPLYDRALAIVAKHYGPGIEHAYPIRMRRALARAWLGHVDEATAELRRVAHEYSRVGKGTMTRPLYHLGVVHRLAGRFREALGAQQAALAAIKDSPLANRERIPVLAEIGLAHLELGELPEARAALETSLAELDRILVSPTPQRADVAVGLARIRLARGDAHGALPLLEATDAYWRGADAGSRWAGEAAWWLARAYSALGRDADAATARSRAATILAASPFPGDAVLAAGSQRR